MTKKYAHGTLEFQTVTITSKKGNDTGFRLSHLQRGVCINTRREEPKCISFVRQLMVLETISTPLRIALVPSCPDRFLVAGCEQGCFAWDIRLDDKPQKNR